MPTPAQPAEPAKKKDLRKVRVKAVCLIWNGKARIREGSVFNLDVEHDQNGKPKLPRCVELYVEEKAEEVTLGKRQKDDKPTNTASDPANGK